MHIKFVTWFIVTRFKLLQLIRMWFHTDIKKPLALVLVYTGILQRMLGNKKLGLNLILKGRRIFDVARATSIIRKIVCGSDKNISELKELLPKCNMLSVEDMVGRILILKLPVLIDTEVVERGVIIVKFTETFSPIYELLNVPLLLKYFRIILEPSWVGYSLPEILVWARFDQEKIMILSPYQDDYKFLSALDTNLVPMTLGSADWVDTSRFFKIAEEKKTYDVIYLANFNPIKRVERYIQAIVKICRVQPDFKAALVLASHGDAKQEVLLALEKAKINSSLSIFYNLDQVEINKLFNKSKVNILISLREGQNKGLAEGLFAGVPALLIKESAGGNYMHINDQTGRVVPDSKLEETLLWFSEHHVEFTPDKWAMSHISPLVSAKILSEKLKEIDVSEGRQWITAGILPKVNRPELSYLNPEDRWLLSKRLELLKKFSKGGNIESVKLFLEKLSEQR